MVYVILSVICSVTVSVILKLARRQHVDTFQIIVWNYPIAVLCTFLFLRPAWEPTLLDEAPLLQYFVLAMLLPGVFFALSASIRYAGIVRTEVAQRLSLFITLIAAFLLFNESIQYGKLIGVGVGVAGILCSIGWHRGKNQHGINRGVWLYPLLVFFGYGIIDIQFKQLAQYSGISYTLSMLVVFVLAMIVSFILLIYRISALRHKFSVHAVFWGTILGAFNFANILFYMKAHRALSQNPSIVFTGMNVGVITVGAVVGIFLFGEKLSFVNKIGLILAILSVFIIACT